MPGDWITLIVPVAGIVILVGIVIVGWISIREKSQMPRHRHTKAPDSVRRPINPKTGGRY